MRPSEAFSLHRDEIGRIVEAHCGSAPRLFGSTVRGEDSETSDIDILIDPGPEMTLFDIARMELALNTLLGVEVHVTLSNSLNERLKKAIFAEALIIS